MAWPGGRGHRAPPPRPRPTPPPRWTTPDRPRPGATGPRSTAAAPRRPGRPTPGRRHRWARPPTAGARPSPPPTTTPRAPRPASASAAGPPSTAKDHGARSTTATTVAPSAVTPTTRPAARTPRRSLGHDVAEGQAQSHHQGHERRRRRQRGHEGVEQPERQGSTPATSGARDATVHARDVTKSGRRRSVDGARRVGGHPHAARRCRRPRLASSAAAPRRRAVRGDRDGAATEPGGPFGTVAAVTAVAVGIDARRLAQEMHDPRARRVHDQARPSDRWPERRRGRGWRGRSPSRSPAPTPCPRGRVSRAMPDGPHGDAPQHDDLVEQAHRSRTAPCRRGPGSPWPGWSGSVVPTPVGCHPDTKRCRSVAHDGMGRSWPTTGNPDPKSCRVPNTMTNAAASHTSHRVERGRPGPIPAFTDSSSAASRLGRRRHRRDIRRRASRGRAALLRGWRPAGHG